MKPYRRIDMRLIGIGLPVTEIVTDDVDAGGALGYFTPALTHELLRCCVNYTETAIKVANPDQVAGVEEDITRASPGGMPPGFNATAADDEGKADRAIKPLSIALGVFGGITALAALLIAVQVIGRHLRRRQAGIGSAAIISVPTRTTLAIGRPHRRCWRHRRGVAAGRWRGGCSFADQPARPDPALLPDPRDLFRLDCSRRWVRGSFRRPCSCRNRARHSGIRPSGWPAGSGLQSRVRPCWAATHCDLPAPATIGLRFALQPGSEIDTVPMRSAIVGAALAVIVLIATVTFGASLDHLVSTPRLYGWNWSYALSGGDGGGGGDIPAQRAATLLAHDHYLSAYSGVYFCRSHRRRPRYPGDRHDPGATSSPRCCTATISNNLTR